MNNDPELIHICASIEYDTLAGPVHSDLCADNMQDGTFSEDYRAILHESLDEWLENSGGTGVFTVGGC